MGELFTLRRFKAMCNTVIVLITHLHYQCIVYAIFGTATIPGLRRISGQTVRRRLHAAGLRAYRPAVRLVLMDRHRLARVAWARTHARWIRNDWRRVVFQMILGFVCREVMEGLEYGGDAMRGIA